MTKKSQFMRWREWLRDLFIRKNSFHPLKFDIDAWERAGDEQAKRDAIARLSIGYSPSGWPRIPPQKPEVYRTRSGRFKWRIRSVDGTVVRVSEKS